MTFWRKVKEMFRCRRIDLKTVHHYLLQVRCFHMRYPARKLLQKYPSCESFPIMVTDKLNVCLPVLLCTSRNRKRFSNLLFSVTVFPCFLTIFTFFISSARNNQNHVYICWRYSRNASMLKISFWLLPALGIKYWKIFSKYDKYTIKPPLRHHW